MKRKLLALLLAMAMLVGMLPASVFAAGTSSDGTAAVADEETTYTETSVSYSTYSWDTTCTGTNYGTMTGYYYKSGETYYQVYYIYSTESDNSNQTNNVIALYYYANGQYNAISTTLYEYGPNSSNSVTLYYSSTSGDSGDDGGDDDTDDPSDTYNSNAELEAAAYRSSALVYWDIDHGTGSTDTDHDANENTAYITSVTLGSTTTTDDDGNETEEANSVTMYDTTDSNFGSADTNFSWDSSTAGTETVSLDDVYDTKDGYGNTTDKATLTITPATGYYVTSVTIVCSAYVGEGSGDPQSDDFTVTYKRISPYNCSTYSNNQAYDGSFNLSNAGGTASALTLTVDISSLYFSHDGYILSSYETNSDGETLYYQLNSDGTVNYDSKGTTVTAYPVYADDGVQAVYFILIEVEEIPTPAYVEYDFGDIVTYITDELGDDASNYSAFSTASGWTDASTKNVYSDIDSDDEDTSYANTVTGTGGAMTDDTQFEYVYDDTEDENTEGGGTTDENTGTDPGGGGTFGIAAASDESETSDDVTTADGETGTDPESDGTDDGTTDGDTTDGTDTEEDTTSTGYSSWKHYANSITEDAVKQAAAAGYVFAGWAVTYYTDAEVAADSSGNYTTSTTNYNKYSITFSTDSGTSSITTMVGEGDEVTVAGHVRLVAMWIKIDSSQVIDYGLPVAVDVEEALLGDADIYAITSNVTSRTSVTTDYSSATTKDLEVSADVSITTDDNSTTTATGDYGTITISSTSSGDGTSTTADSSDDTSVTYTLSKALEDVEDFDYTVKLTYGSSTTLFEKEAGTLYIIPATSMYYEESFGVTYGNAKYTSNGSSVTIYNTVKTDAGGTSGSSSSSGTGGLIDYYWGSAFWVLATSVTDSSGTTTSVGQAATTSKVGTTAQETGIVGTEDDSTYGADDYYLSSSNLGDSDGSTMYVDTSSYAASFTYTFTGTGTAIYTRTLDDSDDQEGAYIRVIIWEGDEEGEIPDDDDTTTTAETDGEDEIEAVGTWFIDTRIVDNVSDSSTLYNIPVFSYTELEYGTYTVSVLVYKEDTPVLATYTIDGQADENGSVTLEQAYSGTTTTTSTDDEGNETTTTSKNYLYYVYSDSSKTKQLYYAVDKDGNSTEGTDDESISEAVTDYPVYYTSTDNNAVSYTVTSTTESEDGSTTTTTTTYYLRALYFLADDTSGGDFYLDGIRIYNPLGTEDDNVSTDNEDDDTWDIASAAYEEDDEANNVVINIAQKLAADAEEGYTNTFVTLTDYYGTIEGYDKDDTYDHPDNEIYLDSSSSTTDEDGNTTTTTYSVSFYLAVDSSTDSLDNYDVYLGLKAPDGTAGSVYINDTKVTVSSSADCYYLLDSYLSSTPEAITLKDESGNTTDTLYGYEVTITGDSGLIALTYIKVTGTDEFDIAYSSDVETENEYSEDPDDGSTDGGTDDTGEAAVVSTLYLLSAASVELEDEDDTTTDEDMLDDDSMAVDPDDDEDADSESDDTEEDEEDEDSVFEPETFTASITYLKLLRYASITVKTSSDVSYITVNGTVVTGRSYGSSGTKTFSYTASRVSAGTTYEIIAYDSDGTASEPITLTAK